MIQFDSLNSAQLISPSVVTIGVFDGVHRGHQRLIKQLIEHGARHHLTPVVLTFFPYPEMIIHGSQPGYYVTLPARKAALLNGLGIEIVITQPFNNEVRKIRAAAFVEQLKTNLRMASLWVGADFAMGYKREGDIEFLRKAAMKHDFDLRIVDLMDAGGERVSSTRIRQALAVGDVLEAARLLGRPHRISGMVVRGAGRGRLIGVPTANLLFPVEQAIPSRGVYAARASVDGALIQCVVNIGVRPTFDGGGEQTVEAHLLDFAGDIYDHEISLDFVSRLRDEKKFDGIDALVAQIYKDIVEARNSIT